MTFPDNDLHPLRQVLCGHEIEWRPRQALGAEPLLFLLTSTLGFHLSRRKILFVDYPIGEFKALATSLLVLTQTSQLLTPSSILSRALLEKQPTSSTVTACNSPVGPTPLLKPGSQSCCQQAWPSGCASENEFSFTLKPFLSFALLPSQSGSPRPLGASSTPFPLYGLVGNSASTRTAASRPITLLCSFSEVHAIYFCPLLVTSSSSGT